MNEGTAGRVAGYRQDQNSKNVTECVNLAEMNLIAGYKRTQFANMKTV